MAQKNGIVIVGHGSRLKQNNAHFFALCESMQAHSIHPVTGALLDFSEQTIQKAVRELIATGCTHIIAVPFLLYGGIHLTVHIPERIEEVIDTPTISYEVVDSLGSHPLVLEALTQKITQIKE